MNKKLIFVFAAVMLVPVALLGQEKAAAQATGGANPITGSEKGFYSFVSGAVNLLAVEENALQKTIPSNLYCRFAALTGGLAMWPTLLYSFCSQAIGEANPVKDIEKTGKTSKADLVAALNNRESANCNKAFERTTNAKGSEMVKSFNFNIAKLTVLSINTAHTDEHYGNMVTYLPLKGVLAAHK